MMSKSEENTNIISYRGISTVSRKENPWQIVTDQSERTASSISSIMIIITTITTLTIITIFNQCSLPKTSSILCLPPPLIMKHLHIWEHAPNQVITHHFP